MEFLVFNGQEKVISLVVHFYHGQFVGILGSLNQNLDSFPLWLPWFGQ